MIEHDLSVPTEVLELVLEPMVAHTSRAGGRVFETLPPNVAPDEVVNRYRESLKIDEIRRQVRFQTSGAVRSSEEVAPLVLPSPVQDLQGSEPRTPEAIRFLRDGARVDRPNLSVVWVPALRAFASERGVDYSADTLPGMAFAYLSASPLHTVFLGPAEDPWVASLRSMAGIRLRFQSAAGRVFVWGERPPTPSFVLSEGNGSSGKPYRLLRIVRAPARFRACASP